MIKKKKALTKGVKVRNKKMLDNKQYPRAGDCHRTVIDSSQHNTSSPPLLLRQFEGDMAVVTTGA